MRTHSPQHRGSNFSSLLEPASAGVAQTTSVAASIRREGEFWTVDYRGEVYHLRDSKGLRFIAHLLANPGREVRALDLLVTCGGGLAAEEAPAVWRDSSTVAVSDAGELIDQSAKDAYRSRIRGLQVDLTQAKASSDVTRAESIEAELGSLTRELRRAVGLGGRSRRAGSAQERARINVTRTIRSAIERVQRRNFELGSILEQSIATGNVCVYTPRPSVVWVTESGGRDHSIIDLHGASTSSTRGGPASGISRLTTFIGREEELRMLRALLAQAMQGNGQLALIGGSAGVGKTRLAVELGEHAKRLAARVVVGRCDERQNGLPYLPFAEILETIFGDAADPEDLRATLGPEASEVARLVPQVARVLKDLGSVEGPSKLPPEQARRNLFIAIGNLLARIARGRPLVLIVDDLQWADESSLLLLVYLMRRISNMRMLVLATFRDFDLDERGGFAHALEEMVRERTVQMLTLDGLEHESCALLLQELANQNPPATLLTTFLHETEGNPFFIEELFRHLAEEKMLFDAAGHFRSDLKISEISLPRNLRLVLRRRLSRLDSSTRAMICLAAAIGRTFSYELLRSLAAGDPEVLLDQIETAERAGLIRSVSDWLGARMEFSHELIRQTLLADVSSARRQRLHLAIADAIERSRPGSVVEDASELAYHLYMAGPEAEPERTVAQLRASARQMAARFAYGEALGWLGSSLEVLPGIEPRSRRLGLELAIRHEMSLPLLVSRGFSSPELQASTARVLELCREVDDPDSAFAALTSVWNFSLDRGDLVRAGETASWLMSLAIDSSPMRTVIANYAAGSTMFFRGELRRARAHFEHASSLYQPANHAALDPSFVSDPGVISLAHDAVTLWRLGFPDQALAACDRAVALALEIAHPSSLAHALFHAAEIRHCRGDFAGAIEMATRSIVSSTNSGLSYWLGLATAARGAALVRAKSPEEGIAEVLAGERPV